MGETNGELEEFKKEIREELKEREVSSDGIKKKVEAVEARVNTFELQMLDKFSQLQIYLAGQFGELRGQALANASAAQTTRSDRSEASTNTRWVITTLVAVGIAMLSAGGLIMTLVKMAAGK